MRRENFLPGVEGSKKRGELPKTEAEQKKLAEKMGIEKTDKEDLKEALTDIRAEKEKAEWEEAIEKAKRDIEQAGAENDNHIPDLTEEAEEINEKAS